MKKIQILLLRTAGRAPCYPTFQGYMAIDGEGEDWPPEAKKMKSLTLHTHGCLRVSVKDCSPSSYQTIDAHQDWMSHIHAVTLVLMLLK